MRRAPDVDEIAHVLAMLARTARALPPSWDGAEDSFPVLGPEGAALARVLPGRGLYIDRDLRSLGVGKRIPHVYERTPFMRALERLGSQRGAITQGYRWMLDAWSTYGQQIVPGPSVIATPYSGWQLYADRSGLVPPTVPLTAASSGGETRDNTTLGSLIYGARPPSGGRTAFIAQIAVFWTASALPGVGAIMVADRLWGADASADMVIGTYTINSIALTRYTSGVGVCWMGWAPGLDGTDVTSTVSISYTNQSGTAGQSPGATAFFDVGSGASGFPGACISLDATPANVGVCGPLAAGDYGVRSIQSMTVGGANLAGSQFWLTLFKPLAILPFTSEQVEFEWGARYQYSTLAPLATTAGGQLGFVDLITYNQNTYTVSVRTMLIEG